MRKKLLTGLLAVAMVLSLCACGKNGTETGKDDGRGAWGSGRTETDNPSAWGSNRTELSTSDTNQDVTITRNETATIEYEDFSNGYVNMKIPKGWAVDIYNPQLIPYMIRVYNPQNPDCCFAFQIYYDYIYKSEAARNLLVNYYGEEYEQYIVCNPQNSSGYFGEYLSLNHWGTDFSVVQELGTNALGGQVIQGSFTGTTGVACEGIFTTTISDVGNTYVSEDITNIYSNQIDIMVLIASCTFMYYAPEADFINWQPIMNYCLSTLTFTQQFEQDRQEAWNQVLQTSYQISQTYDQISDMVMDSWESRNTSYDIMSQKNSDSILGQERIYDTETDEVYLADLGWSDSNSDPRYELVTEDSYYLIPTSGWID